ncbi:hypothetical protein ACJMK2_042781 [Sinanodonta woodiana]|uniref:F-box only protein 22 n=1 Tax=Sinanodonta woodiana TaxID=1069815 RepID=A0ABD3VYF1_SINWO
MDQQYVNESYVLTCLPTVINNVLNCMTAQELNVCARVCRCWSSAVRVIKDKRQERKLISWFSVEITDEEDVVEVFDQIEDFVKSQYSEPAMLFLFCQLQISTRKFRMSPRKPRPRHPKRAAKLKQVEFVDLVKSYLPMTCKFIGVSTNGVIGTSSNLDKIQEVEGEMFVSLLYIPHIKGVDILTLHANIREENITTFIPKEKAVKTILLFCDDPRCPPQIGNTLRENYKGAVIAGGYIDCHVPDLGDGRTFDWDDESKPIFVSCVALCGENVQCASIVLDHKIYTPQTIEDKLLKLKACGLPEEKSFAFMFACFARGKYFYQKENVESSIFKKLFPKTPLFGFFGNGEIGFTHLPGASSGDTRLQLEGGEGQSKGKKSSKMHHAYSTVFCLVSIT